MEKAIKLLFLLCIANNKSPLAIFIAIFLRILI